MRLVVNIKFTLFYLSCFGFLSNSKANQINLEESAYDTMKINAHIKISMTFFSIIHCTITANSP